MTNKIFFTADTHFDHKNIVKYCNRPFSSVDEMNFAMVENWNRTVDNSDIVYHLGDFTLGGIKTFWKWADMLNGNICIVAGGHDYRWMEDFDNDHNKVYSVSELITVQLDKQYPPIVLCHYSMQTWDRSHHGSWHLFGHSHGMLKGVGKSMDVGVDCHNFTPISIEEVASKMSELTTPYQQIKAR